MNDDISAVFEWTANSRGSHCVVNDYWHAIFVCDITYRLDIDNIAQWITDTLSKYHLGFVIDQIANGLRILMIKEAYFDALGLPDSPLWEE